MPARKPEQVRPKQVLIGLQEMIADIISELDPQAALNKAVRRTAELVQADIVTIHIYDPATGQIRAAAGHGLHDEETFQQHIPGRGKAVVLVANRRDPLIAEDVSNSELAGPFSEREGVVSAAGFPLQVGEEVIGALFVSYRTRHTFEPAEIEMLVSFGHLAGVALNNARLFAENERLLQQERELRKQTEMLREVSGTISSAADLDEVKNQILDGLANIVEYNTASLQIIRGNHRTLLAGRGFDIETATRHLVRPISKDPLIKRIVQSQELLILSHTEQDPDWVRRPDTIEVRSWIGIPLIYNREVVGLLTADHRKPGFYQEEMRDALAAFADEVAVAVRSARIFDSVQRRIRDLEIINDVTELMATKLDPEDLLKVIVSQVAERLECTHCTIFFPREQDGEAYLVPEETYGERSTVIRTRRFRSGEGLAGWVFQHGESLVLDNAKEDERFAAAREEQDRPRSMLVVPVKVGDRTIGVISADQDEYSWFGESERRLLDALARQAGIAIERATGLKLLQDIGHRILSAPKVDEILYQVVQGALELTHTTSGVIYLIGKDGLSVTRSYQYPDGFDHPPPRMDSAEGITRQVIRDGQVRTFRDIDVDARVNPVLRDRLIRSMIAVPMKSGQTVIGVLYLNDVQSHQFTDTEISLLTTLASQASIAIENVRLLEARERQAEELKLLHQVSAGLMTLDLDTLLELIIQGAMRLTETESGYIYLLSDDGRRILKSVAFPADAPYPRSAPSEGGLTRYIFDHREPVFVGDTDQDGRVNPAVRAQQIKSLVGQPLKIAERVIGILYLNDTSHRAFSASERSLISTLAEQAAIAIYNARLFADSERLSRGHQMLSAVGTTLMGMLDEKEILKYVARSTANTLDCTHCTVFRVQEDQLVVETAQGDRDWSFQEGRRFRRGQGLAGWVAEEGKPKLVLDAKADERFDPGWSEPEPDPESLVLAPIVVGNQVYGVISAEQNRTHAFDPYDQQLLETLASQASQALQNAQLFATRQRLETQLESLHQVVQEQNLDMVLERTVEGIRAILGESISPTINLYNEETEKFARCHACGPLQKALQVPPRSGGTGRYVIGTGEPLYLPDVHDPPPGAPEVRQEAIDMGIQSFAAIPLKREDHIVGVLYVNAQKPLSFSPETRRVLELFAGQAAIAIENARLFEQLERRVRELEALTEIGRTVSKLGIDQILALVYEEMGKIIDLHDAQVQFAFYDETKDEVSFPLAVEQDHGETIDVVRWGKRDAEYRKPDEGEAVEQFMPRARREPPGLNEYVIRSKRALLIVEDFKQKADAKGIQVWPEFGRLNRPTDSWLGVPMLVGGHVTGVISIQSLQKEHAFDQGHVQVLGAVANQAAVAIENARLYDEMEKRVAERTRAWQEEQERASAAEKLALMSDVAAEFAHRMNNLAGTIPVRAGMAKEHLDPNDSQQARAIDQLDKIASDAKLLLEAAREIKSTTETRAAEPVDVNGALEVALGRVWSSKLGAEGTIQVKTDPQNDLPPLFVERNKLLDTLVSIIQNGVEAMPEGGTLTLTTRLGVIGDRSCVEIIVSDTGTGIPASDLPRIFDLFFTTKERGLGFGLWRDRVFVKNLDGDIEVQSTVGEGTTFTIKVPVPSDTVLPEGEQDD